MGSLRSKTTLPPRAMRGRQCCLCMPSGSTKDRVADAFGAREKSMAMSGISGGGVYGATGSMGNGARGGPMRSMKSWICAGVLPKGEEYPMLAPMGMPSTPSIPPPPYPENCPEPPYPGPPGPGPPLGVGASSRRRFFDPPTRALDPPGAIPLGSLGGANRSPPNPYVPSARITTSTRDRGKVTGLEASHSSSSGASGAHDGRAAYSASISSCSVRGSCLSLSCSVCASHSLRHRSSFFSSRLSWSSTTAYTMSMCFRIWRILSKDPASFSRRRRVCGRLVFSRWRNTLNGFASLGAGGGCKRRKHGFPVLARFAHQYSYTASMIAGLPDMSFSRSSALSFGSASVPAIAAHLS
mmetsp:Transcript_13714/g.57653  ORF Transcript_13714/g.57653 Transcript_13714/m.57653 type:complete len:354 (+) Transcript_13714:357-1418(+)